MTGKIKSVLLDKGFGFIRADDGTEPFVHVKDIHPELEWNEADGNLYMTGPATEVFSGEWPG